MARKDKLSPNQLAKLKNNFAGLKGIGNYAPVNAEFKVAAIQPIADAIDDLLEQRAQKQAEIDDLDDQIADKGAMFVQKMKGVGQQVIAQFGDDSAEVQAIGRKRSSERKPRSPKKPK